MSKAFSFSINSLYASILNWGRKHWSTILIFDNNVFLIIRNLIISKIDYNIR